MKEADWLALQLIGEFFSEVLEPELVVWDWKLSHFLLPFDLRLMTTTVPSISGMHAGLSGKPCGHEEHRSAQSHGRFLMIFLVIGPH